MTQSVLNTVLSDSLILVRALVEVQTLAEQGNEAMALDVAASFKPDAEDLLPRLRGLIKGLAVAQAQAEQVRDLPKPRIVCLAAFGQPQPHPHTANTHSPPPHSPGPKVA